MRERNDDRRADEHEPSRLSNDELAACGALMLLLLASYLLNTFVFPQLAKEGLFPAGREISTYCGAACSAAIALAAFRKPSLLRETPLSVAALAIFACGLALLGVAFHTGNSSLAALGSPLGGIGAVWFSVLVGLALVRIGVRASAVAIPLAFVARYIVQAVIQIAGVVVSPIIALLLYFACNVCAYALMRPFVRDLVRIARKSGAPIELDATNPSSFLPVSSLVYVSIFLFNAACGFAFSGRAANEPGAVLLLGSLPVIAVFLVAAGARRRLSADVLYMVSTLLVVGGFLLAPLPLAAGGSAVGEDASGILLEAGSECFSLLTYYLVAAVGSRNPAGALSTSALATAAGFLGIGCGALLEQGISHLGAHDAALSMVVASGVTLAFIAFNFCAMRSFSFEATIQGVHPMHPAGNGTDAALMGHACPERNLEAASVIAAERFGLTPREVDVLQLLARGRTSSVIQEKLFLSNNTVKTHVRHIYTKMDVHSQQELMTLVESFCSRDGI